MICYDLLQATLKIILLKILNVSLMVEFQCFDLFCYHWQLKHSFVILKNIEKKNV
jgi:hypothetical protein